MSAPARSRPFRAKGLVYLGAREYYAEQAPGGLAAVERALESEEIRAFVRQPFVAGGWYDVLPLVPFSIAAARVIGVPHTTLVRSHAAKLAERDIHGVYRVLLKLASPELVASRLPRASMQYFDWGTASGEMVADRTYRATMSGVPEELAVWFTACVEGFVPVALGTAGARNVEVRPRKPERSNDGTLSLIYDFRWA